MYKIETESKINASRKQVWDILTDVRSYPFWNPFVTELEGGLAPGEKVVAKLVQPGSKPMVIRPTILKADIDKGLVWKGHTLLPGVFDGEHHFELEETGPDTCLFRHYEVFTGVLVPLFKSMLKTKTKKGFQLMNEALQGRAESRN